ncbi:MAG: PD-(D/E)XK nuclease family protein, partial [Candidatus Aenigmarchaeota archaeon]|nr:PD-(D/E)XK nuclease family protein [Candidatus Aenigmarchaeota archaeon]
IPIERLRGEIVYLKTGKTVSTEKTKEQLKDLEDFITTNAKIMLNAKNKDDFPASPNRNCKGCNFATICEEGKKLLN